MRVLKEPALALAVVMAISTLSACGDNDIPLDQPQGGGSPSAVKNPAGGVNSFVEEFNEEIFRSKVTSADSTARELIVTVNSWIADDVCAGSDEKTACELKIVMNNGKATVTDLSGKNDWEGKEGVPQSLKERFERDYSGRTFTATVFVDESGYAVYSWCIQDDAGYNGVAPSFEDFRAGKYAWKSENRVGLTTDKAIMGTSPKLLYPEDLKAPPEPFSKPEGWTNAKGLNKDEIRGAVTMADSMANEIHWSVNGWIADDFSMGGAEKISTSVSIVMNAGKATVNDLAGVNDWSGTGGLKSLAERFEEDYSGRTFTAEVILDGGYAAYVWYVPDDPQFYGSTPSRDSFEAGAFGWNKNCDGLSEENVIIGTYPKLRGVADER